MTTLVPNLNLSEPERSLLRLNREPPSIGSVSDLLRGSLLAAAEKRWPGISGAPDLLSRMTSGQRATITAAHSELWATWEGLRSGANSRMPSVPFCLRGMVPLLDGWLEDLGAWRLQQLADNTDWALETLDWVMSGKDRPGKQPEMPKFPCDLVETWTPEATWVGLMPAPGLSYLPGVLQWDSLGAVRSHSLRCVGMGAELMVQELTSLLWSPEDPFVRSELLQAAHQQGAVYQVIPNPQ